MTHGTLPLGWSTAQLEDLVEVLDAQRVPVSAKERAQRPGRVPYYGAAGQVGTIDKALFDEPLLLLGEDGIQFFDPAKTKAYIIDGQAWVNNHAHVLRTPDGFIDRRFLKYFLDTFDYVGYANGTTRLKLTRSALNRIPVPVPPWREQIRVAETLEEQLDALTRVDKGLAWIDRRLTSLELAVTSAAVAGRLVPGGHTDSTDEVVRIMRSRHRIVGKAPRRPAYQLADLPAGWSCVSVDELSERIDYGTSAKAHVNFVDGDVPVLRMGNIKNGRLLYDNLKFLPADHPDVASLTLKDGDILFNRTNSAEHVGKTAVFSVQTPTFTWASYLIRCRLVQGVDPRWVSLAMNSPQGRDYVASVVSQQVGQANVNGTKLRAFPIPLPPLAAQQASLSAVSAYRQLIDSARKDLAHMRRRCARMRATLLQVAFTGKLVAQDPSDEPVELLLKRLAEVRAAAGPTGGTRGSRRSRTLAQPRNSTNSTEESA